MDRRVFVKLSAFTAMAVSLSLTEGCTPSEHQLTMATPDLLSRLQEKEVLASIGKSYLQQHDAENDADRIITSLLEGGKVNSSSSVEEVKKYLNDRINLDFKNGKTVVADGWILSVTEARQCALFFLIQQ